MLKTLIISVNLIGLMLLNTIVPREIEITHDAPVFATLGEEYTVTVTIDKGKIDGFAKYQVNVPPGMSIHPIETLGASFTFRNGEAKFIWMALPGESVFDITYKLTIENSAKVGNNDMEQWFSYLEKNERMTAYAPLHVIEIASDDVTNSGIKEGTASGLRKITKLNDDHYLVEIDLYKNNIKGFAKLQENLPSGTSAEAVKKANGVFTQLDDKVKVVWFSIPEDENLKIVYEVFSTKGGIGDTPITGVFTYLKDNETKTVEIIQGDIIEISDVAEVLDTTDVPLVDSEKKGNLDNSVDDPSDNSIDIDASDDLTMKTGNDSTVDPPTIDTTSAIMEEVDAPDDTIVRDDSDDAADTSTTTATTEDVIVDSFSDITSTPSPDRGVTYRVQIMAGHNVVDEKYVSKAFKFTRPFDIENHEGWVKYTTGSHGVYMEARDSRVKINDNYNFDGPFVSAYNDGVRITVQEALMISRQKWYQ